MGVLSPAVLIAARNEPLARSCRALICTKLAWRQDHSQGEQND